MFKKRIPFVVDGILSSPPFVHGRFEQQQMAIVMCLQVLNLSNVADWLGQDTFEEADGFVPVNMLCVPIFNGQGEVIGVAQLINKVQR